jgi:L-amino acid N-acyltransferase YncA
MLIRPLEAGDAAALRAFFDRIPEADQRFFKDDISDPETVSKWIGDARARRLVAVGDDGRVHGCAVVVPGIGWSAHMAELRVVVDPSVRRTGVGSQLVWKAFDVSRELGIKKFVTEVVAEQEAAVAMFERLGFCREAVLPGHVRDRDGVEHDLLVLANTGLVAAEWQDTYGAAS